MTNPQTPARGITVPGTNKTSFAPSQQSAPDISNFVSDRGTDGIAGYTYKAENYSPENLVEELIRRGDLSPGARGMRVEDALNQLAEVHASGLDEDDNFDRDDERSFDSDDFPKVITEGQVDIYAHAALGREYWDTPEYDDEPRTAESALQEWMDSSEIDYLELARENAVRTGDLDSLSDEEMAERAEAIQEGLLENTHFMYTAEQNIDQIRLTAENMHIDLHKINNPLPTRHN